MASVFSFPRECLSPTVYWATTTDRELMFLIGFVVLFAFILAGVTGSNHGDQQTINDTRYVSICDNFQSHHGFFGTCPWYELGVEVEISETKVVEETPATTTGSQP